MRGLIKTEFMFTDFLSPVDLMNYYNIAMSIEQEKQDRIDAGKRENYK